MKLYSFCKILFSFYFNNVKTMNKTYHWQFLSPATAISDSSILSQPNFSITFSWSTLPETTHGVTACTSSDDDDSGLCLSKLSISHPTNKRLISCDDLERFFKTSTNIDEPISQTKQKKDINEEKEREGQIFSFIVLTNNKEAHMGFLVILKVLYLEHDYSMILKWVFNDYLIF